MGISQKHLIYGALTFISVLGAMLKVTVFDQPGYGALVMYLGLLYVIFVAWAVSQLRTIHLREREENAAPPETAAIAFVAQVRPPTEETLISAQTYLELGESLETVCMFVEPSYRDWDSAAKQAFRQRLRAAIDERRESNKG